MVSFLRMAVIIILVWLLYKYVKTLLRKLYRQFPQTDTRPPSQVAEMVKDPICGSFVSIDHAEVLERENGRVYFCSKKCKEAYKKS